MSKPTKWTFEARDQGWSERQTIQAKDSITRSIAGWFRFFHFDSVRPLFSGRDIRQRDGKSASSL
jgi:hypothetical protein